MDRTIKAFLVAAAVAVVVLMARRTNRLLPVAFFGPFSIDPVETSNSRQSLEASMTQALQLPQTDRPGFSSLPAAIRAIARAWVHDHTLALRAATKAALPRKNLAELRAMYARPFDPTDSD